MGMTLVRLPRVQRVTVAESAARKVARVGTSGSVARSVSVTPTRAPPTVPFVNGTVAAGVLTSDEWLCGNQASLSAPGSVAYVPGLNIDATAPSSIMIAAAPNTTTSPEWNGSVMSCGKKL